ncbi:MAG: hypothetical protein ACMUHY_08455, partial [Thermoplasmatota archaeon]
LIILICGCIQNTSKDLKDEHDNPSVVTVWKTEYLTPDTGKIDGKDLNDDEIYALSFKDNITYEKELWGGWIPNILLLNNFSFVNTALEDFEVINSSLIINSSNLQGYLEWGVNGSKQRVDISHNDYQEIVLFINNSFNSTIFKTFFIMIYMLGSDIPIPKAIIQLDEISLKAELKVAKDESRVIE